MWIKAAYGDESNKIWKGLAPNILTVTKGWSEAYGLFMDGEADLVLSYTTSPAYHMIAENDSSKKECHRCSIVSPSAILCLGIPSYALGTLCLAYYIYLLILFLEK